MDNKSFYLVYGVPGSGKSTYVERELKPFIKDLQHFEADMFFYDKNGVYNFDFRKLGYAHSWCQYKCKEAMSKGLPVCISNTSLTPRERFIYFKMANEYGYKVYIHQCMGEFQNVHGVPDEKVQLMKKKLTSVTDTEINKFFDICHECI